MAINVSDLNFFFIMFAIYASLSLSIFDSGSIQSQSS